MIIIISPAKNLDFSPEVSLPLTKPHLIEQSKTIMSELSQLKPVDLEKLMKISPKIADLNFERNQNWSYPFEKFKSKAAALAFNGEVYSGLNFSNLSQEDQEYAQSHLFILSGLYGILKPLDEIYPYRLEMGTKLGVQNNKNLYEFWNNSIHQIIDQQLEQQKSRFLVNLASTEYSKAAKLKDIKLPVITPTFKDNKNGNYKVIMMYAKKARGLMTSYIIKNKITDLEELKSFDSDGYVYNENLSEGNNITFTRG